MTSPAIQLARECCAGFALSAGNQAQLIIFGAEAIETFYAKTQAQSLRDAAARLDKQIHDVTDPVEGCYFWQQNWSAKHEHLDTIHQPGIYTSATYPYR